MLSFRSPVFTNGDTIPLKYTQEGENISPPLEWSGLSDHIQELALVCEDPDAPGESPYVHWLIYGIEPSADHLPEGVGAQPELYHPYRARQGLNSAGQIGYIGPLPPLNDDWHRYRFKLYALNHPLDLHAGSTAEDFYSLLSGHVLASAELVAKYHRTERLHEVPPYQKTDREDEKNRPDLQRPRDY